MFPIERRIFWQLNIKNILLSTCVPMTSPSTKSLYDFTFVWQYNGLLLHERKRFHWKMCFHDCILYNFILSFSYSVWRKCFVHGIHLIKLACIQFHVNFSQSLFKVTRYYPSSASMSCFIVWKCANSAKHFQLYGVFEMQYCIAQQLRLLSLL